MKEVPVPSQIAHHSLKGSTSHLTQVQEAVHKKHGLHKWKYAELRDAINTSVGGYSILWVGVGGVWLL